MKFQENSALQQSIYWIKFIKCDWQYYQEGEVYFKKNSTAGLPEVSKLINSGTSKKQGDQRKHSFLEETKYSIKEKMDSLWTPTNEHSFDGSIFDGIDSSDSQTIFSYLKIFNMQCRKTLQWKITKK